MASSAFQITATYDKIISQWFKKKTNKKIKKNLDMVKIQIKIHS